MDKRLLLKYVAGEATPDEVNRVLDWAEQNEANKQYLISLKFTHVASYQPESKASAQEMERMRATILKGAGREETASVRPQTAKLPEHNFRLFTILSTAVAAVAIVAFILKPSIPKGEQLNALKTELIASLKQERLRIELKEMPQERLHTVYTEKGVKSRVELPDGSTVQLNSDTKITFPDTFAGDTREVELSGEAYFQVKGDSAKPMIVSTAKGFQIKVLGTEFNVKSYENDELSSTTLYKGSIHLITAASETKVLPNEQVTINSRNQITHLKPTILDDTKAWTQGRLLFDETPVSEVVKMLERWHGVKIEVKDPVILKYKITAEFKSESIYQIMYVIKNCSLIDYTINENTVLMTSR